MSDSLLVRTPAPFATESMYGYLLRLSAENGYTLGQFLRHVGKRTLNCGPQLPTSTIADVLGAHREELSSIAYGDGNTPKPKLLGKGVRPHHLRLADPAICPACVGERGFIEAIWDSALMVACPIHGTLPLSSCPACHRPLNWLRLGLLTCSCTASLVISRPRGGRDLQSLMQIQAAMVTGSAPPPNPARFPIADLMAMDLQSFMTTVLTLGKQSLISKGRCPKANEQAVVGEAVEVLKGWPEGLFALLERIGHRQGIRSSALGLRAQFKGFFQRVFCAHGDRRNTDFLRRGFVEFGRLRWPHGVVSKKLLADVPRPHAARSLTLSEVGERLGMRYPHLHKMIKDGALPVHIRDAGGSKRYVVDVQGLRPALRRRLQRGAPLERHPCSS